MTDPRVEASLDHWKRKLLDLSKRNRLLNFRPSKVSTVAVVDELPVEVFKTLVGRGKTMRFRPSEQPVVENGGAVDEEEALEDFELFTPAQDAAPAERHADNWLQTRLVEAQLDHRLRRIEGQARTVQEEQGINTLFLALGMLHWYESDDAEELRRAPLLMVPVELDRKGAGSAYTLTLGEDEPLINPALAEYLRTSFGMRLPELPEATEEYDPGPLLAEIAGVVRRHPRWQVTNEIVLGLFSFQKLVMYQDIEKNRQAFAEHRLVQKLVNREGAHEQGLPDDVRALALDESFVPESTHQVVDADSSQLRAIVAAARGHDIVMEGPPGTGKSQTITNLIAHALGSGKTILFVSEKMAALQVVYGRLKAIGLGDACLELHSGKASKRAFIAEIARALDNSLAPPSGGSLDVQRLREVRAELGEYDRALHTPEPALGLTPYEAYGRLASVASAPLLCKLRSTGTATAPELAEALRHLKELASTAAALGDPRQHPWRDTTTAFYSVEERARVERELDALRAEGEAFLRLAPAVEREIGLASPRTLADAEKAATVAGVIARSPGAALEVLRSDAWNSAPADAERTLALGEKVRAEKQSALERLTPAVLEHDHGAEIAVIERLHRRPWRMLLGAYRRARRAWLGYRLPGRSGTIAEQLDSMRVVERVRANLEELARAEASASRLFGAHWRGEASDWKALREYVAWVVEFRGAFVAHGLGDAAAQRASRARPDVSTVRALERHAAELRVRWQALCTLVGWPQGYLSDAPVAELLQRGAALQANFGAYNAWITHDAVRRSVAAGLASEALRAAEAGEVSYDDLARACERSFLEHWLAETVRRRPALLAFQPLSHEQRLAEFRELDRLVLRENRAALQGLLRGRVQERVRGLRTDPGWQFLQGQMARQRGHAALRRTMSTACEAIRAIKPCFMMSPLSVAQFLDAQRHAFDLVVFDEASQLTAEDAIGAVVRGRQIVVVGDPKQLPPTNFFAVQTGQCEPERTETGEPVVEDMESILEQFMAAGLSKARLRWHYRSRHESLIAFSNVNFYDAELHTFPSADTDTRTRGLQFVHVAEGTYEGAGLNRAEARRVADAVMEFAREQLARPESERLTLGVGTFNLRQQLAVQDEIEARRRAAPEAEAFFAPREEGAFFVKNLENIQGDDRDVIFLSVTYARGNDGKLLHNFGPINGQNGWRRLNVLTTRSRLRMRVFSSIRGEDINPTKTTSDGARLLKEFLTFAERGRLESVHASEAARSESPFEREMHHELTRRGLRLQPQVGVAGYRIDLGVLDDEVEGRFVCGIECDGATYHGAESARDRDRLRQEVLEGLGWKLHRVWSTDWFKDREGTIQRLLARVEEFRELERARSAQDPAPLAVRAPLAEPARDGEPPASPLETVRESALAPPRSAPYVAAQLGAREERRGVLEASFTALLACVLDVARGEAPVHRADLFARVAAACGDARVGTRIERRLEEALAGSEQRGAILRRGDFVYLPDGGVTVRSRAATGIPAERIAPEEYRAAVLLVLDARGRRARPALAADVRGVLGFSRTGAKLEARITEALDALLQAGEIGETSTGLARMSGSGAIR